MKKQYISTPVNYSIYAESELYKSNKTKKRIKSVQIYCALAVIRVHPVRIEWQIDSASLYYACFFRFRVYIHLALQESPHGWHKEPKFTLLPM